MLWICGKEARKYLELQTHVKDTIRRVRRQPRVWDELIHPIRGYYPDCKALLQLITKKSK
jgi:hypothetical protein